MAEHLRSDNLFKFPDFSLQSSQIPWLFPDVLASFHFPRLFPEFQDSGSNLQFVNVSCSSTSADRQ